LSSGALRLTQFDVSYEWIIFIIISYPLIVFVILVFISIGVGAAVIIVRDQGGNEQVSILI